MQDASHARREGCEKSNACPHTIVHAVPAFICKHGYPIGYLMSCNHDMFLNKKMALATSYYVDEAI